jgi:acyl-CoA thioester hydrolase
MRPKINPNLYTFQISWRIRFYEVDLQGVVHHAQMIKYMEIGRVEYWRQLGIGYQDFLDSGLQYVVARVECDYLKPLYFDNILTMMVRVLKFSRTSITYEYLIMNDQAEAVVFGKTVLVCLKTGGSRPHPLPKEYLTKILDFEKKNTVEHKPFN